MAEEWRISIIKKPLSKKLLLEKNIEPIHLLSIQKTPLKQAISSIYLQEFSEYQKERITLPQPKGKIK